MPTYISTTAKNLDLCAVKVHFPTALSFPEWDQLCKVDVKHELILTVRRCVCLSFARISSMKNQQGHYYIVW